jgi:hypothetical protein
LFNRIFYLHRSCQLHLARRSLGNPSTFHLIIVFDTHYRKHPKCIPFQAHQDMNTHRPNTIPFIKFHSKDHRSFRCIHFHRH